MQSTIKRPRTKKPTHRLWANNLPGHRREKEPDRQQPELNTRNWRGPVPPQGSVLGSPTANRNYAPFNTRNQHRRNNRKEPELSRQPSRAYSNQPSRAYSNQTSRAYSNQTSIVSMETETEGDVVSRIITKFCWKWQRVLNT